MATYTVKDEDGNDRVIRAFLAPDATYEQGKAEIERLHPMGEILHPTGRKIETSEIDGHIEKKSTRRI